MRSFKSDPDPLDPGRAGFAHRGLHGPGIPENSMAAFRAAIEAGAGIECDVRLSGDGEVIVFHDHDLRRLCASALAVEATPAAILAAQRLAGTGEQLQHWAGSCTRARSMQATCVPRLAGLARRGASAPR